ncbi:MAG: hypothetical protein AB8B55_02145 [Mariniblastus sp.]
MRFQATQPKRRIPRRSFARSVFGGCKVLAFLIAVGIICWLLFHQTVHNKIRDKVQEKISEKLNGSGLAAHVGQADFIEGQGLRITDLAIKLACHDQSSPSHTTSPQSAIEIYEAFVHAPVSMTELVSGKLPISGMEVRRAKLTLVRKSDGHWDFEELYETLSKLRPESDSPIPLAFKDCEIAVIDLTRPQQRPISLTNVNLVVQQRMHDARPILQIYGGCQSRIISQINFVSFLDLHNRIWKTEMGATDATLSRDLIAILPDSLQSELSGLQTLSGKINFQGLATGTTTLDTMPNFKFTGNVSGFSIDDPRLPLPVHNASGTFAVGNGGLAINNARGRLGQGEFAINYWQSGLLQRQSWHCDGKVEDFEFDNNARLERWLPSYCQKFCKEYSPKGTSNITFDLTKNGNQLKRDIVGKLTNMSFSYFKMPYRANQCIGTVAIKDSQCNFDIESVTSNQKILIDGFVKGLGIGPPTYEVNLSVPGDLPIDPKMLAAIDSQPKFAKVIRAFSPTGRVGGIGKIEKLIPEGQTKKTFDIRLKHCSIRHQSFDYPIHNVSGLVHAEDLDFTFKGLRGNNSGGKVECDGNWNPINGLNLVFFCKSIPLDDQLRFALKPNIREIWNGFRPRGTMDAMKVEMKLPIGHSEVDLVVTADMQKPNGDSDASHVSIHPTWFPYAINQLTGQVKIGNGVVTLRNIEGKHHRTSILCQGEGGYSDDSWFVRLKNMLVLSLKVDEDLLKAVPSSLAPPVRQLKYEGLVTVSGEITIAGNQVGTDPAIQTVAYSSTPDLSPNSGGDFIAPSQRVSPTVPRRPNYKQNTTMTWDVQLDMVQAKMQIGLPVENVSGNVKLFGKFDGQNAECLGELDIDSLSIYDAQITKVRGPIWIDNQHTAAGQFVRPPKDPTNISPVAIKPIKLRPIEGKMHHGTVNFDAKMLSGGKGEFFLKATLSDGCLATACHEYAPSLENIEGRSFAAVEMSGDYTGTHSNRGVGTIQLRDAKIYELPVFLALLKIPNFRKYSRTAFDSSNIDFTIQGDTIDFNRMEFLGDAISLIGNGRMNFDWDIDLNFYSVMGRDRINIPLISELYRASSQRVLWIQVDGTLDNPQTHRNVLPNWDIPELRKLFNPREKSRLARTGLQNLNPRNPNAQQLNQPPDQQTQPIGSSFFR